MIDVKKIVEETVSNYLNYNSILLYHGTKKEFDSFDLKFFNSGSGDGGWLGRGVYLTNDYEYAESYAEPDGSVLECKINITNPLILTDSLYSSRPLKLMNEFNADNNFELNKILKEKGYDSVVLQYEDSERSWLDKFIEVCIFNPNDIKILKKYNQGDDSSEVNKKRGFS